MFVKIAECRVASGVLPPLSSIARQESAPGSVATFLPTTRSLVADKQKSAIVGGLLLYSIQRQKTDSSDDGERGAVYLILIETL